MKTETKNPADWVLKAIYPKPTLIQKVKAILKACEKNPNNSPKVIEHQKTFLKSIIDLS